MLKVDRFMADLSALRPVFHSEADLQHAFAWGVHEAAPDCKIRLEFPFPSRERRRYLDIWLPDEGIAIELKYPTRNLKLRQRGESYSLRDQSAQDLGRYDFLKDIQRLELLCEKWGACRAGLAVLLTNEPLYWKPPLSKTTVDAALRLHEGRTVTGEMAWASHAGPGTMEGREPPVHLRGSYDLRWQDYSSHPEKYGKFRYLAVSVG